MEPIYSISRTEDKQELIAHETPLFPCTINDKDVRQYVTGEVPPHWHHEMEIFLLLEGQAHISFMDAEFDLKPGEGYFANSDVLHGVSGHSGDACHFHSIVFDPGILSGVPGSAYDVLYVRPFIKQSGFTWIFGEDDNADGAEIIRFFQTAFTAGKKETAGYEFTVRDALSQILLLLKGHMPEVPDRQHGTQERRMKQMLSWLDAHYMEPVTVARLADAAHICVRECQRSFADTFHTTPMKYLNRRRITAAADFLLSTDMPVSEIGTRCGFDSPSYFTKQFKALTGKTPREYRMTPDTSI